MNNNFVKMISVREVLAKTNISRATLYRLEKAGLFPARRRISPGRIGWLESEVDDHISTSLKLS